MRERMASWARREWAQEKECWHDQRSYRVCVYIVGWVWVVTAILLVVPH